MFKIKSILFLSLLLSSISSYSHSVNDKELKCLADTIYHEGRGLDVREQVMIGKVVINRLNNPNFPKSICSVVYQKAKGKNGKSVRQFSWTANGNKINEPEAHKRIIALAERLVKETPLLHGKSTGPLFFSKPVSKICRSGKICHRFR